MLKTLREDGFKATAFERRDKVGGLWAYSENPKYTTALPGEQLVRSLSLAMGTGVMHVADMLPRNKCKHQQVHLRLHGLSYVRS